MVRFLQEAIDVFPAAILAIFVYGMIAAMLGTILPGFSVRFNVSPKQNGNIALVQALGLIAAAIFAGPLIESQGTKAGLALGLGLAAAALLLLPRSKGAVRSRFACFCSV